MRIRVEGDHKGPTGRKTFIGQPLGVSPRSERCLRIRTLTSAAALDVRKGAAIGSTQTVLFQSDSGTARASSKVTLSGQEQEASPDGLVTTNCMYPQPTPRCATRPYIGFPFACSSDPYPKRPIWPTEKKAFALARYCAAETLSCIWIACCACASAAKTGPRACWTKNIWAYFMPLKSPRLAAAAIMAVSAFRHASVILPVSGLD